MSGLIKDSCKIRIFRPYKINGKMCVPIRLDYDTAGICFIAAYDPLCSLFNGIATCGPSSKKDNVNIDHFRLDRTYLNNQQIIKKSSRNKEYKILMHRFMNSKDLPGYNPCGYQQLRSEYESRSNKGKSNKRPRA
jgi:hypothetical protein